MALPSTVEFLECLGKQAMKIGFNVVLLQIQSNPLDLSVGGGSNHKLI